MTLLAKVGAMALALFAPVLVSAVPPTINSGMPPVRYQGDAAAVVIFTDRAGINQICGVAPDPYIILACAGEKDGVPIVTMPNPCAYGASEHFAKIMCHEMAHVQGWPATHGD